MCKKRRQEATPVCMNAKPTVDAGVTCSYLHGLRHLLVSHGWKELPAGTEEVRKARQRLRNDDSFGHLSKLGFRLPVMTAYHAPEDFPTSLRSRC